MGGLPAGNFAQGGTRFSLGISDPTAASSPTLYTGFDYYDLGGTRHTAQVYKSTDNGANWTATATGRASTRSSTTAPRSVRTTTGEARPEQPGRGLRPGVLRLQLQPAVRRIFRSTDGGATWKNLGYDLHPDFHASPSTRTTATHGDRERGGVWQSETGGGRNNPADPLSAADWQDLNGQVNPNTAALIHSTGLQISQFTSIGGLCRWSPGQYWGGTQDNGTLRKSLANNRWFDQASGDGGQVIIDQTTPNNGKSDRAGVRVRHLLRHRALPVRPVGRRIRSSETRAIDGGINMGDRSEFYVPWVQNRGNVNQMFLGTFRLYRTDNAETANVAGCDGNADQPGPHRADAPVQPPMARAVA